MLVIFSSDCMSFGNNSLSLDSPPALSLTMNTKGQRPCLWYLLLIKKNVVSFHWELVKHIYCHIYYTAIIVKSLVNYIYYLSFNNIKFINYTICAMQIAITSYPPQDIVKLFCVFEERIWHLLKIYTQFHFTHKLLVSSNWSTLNNTAKM